MLGRALAPVEIADHRFVPQLNRKSEALTGLGRPTTFAANYYEVAISIISHCALSFEGRALQRAARPPLRTRFHAANELGRKVLMS